MILCALTQETALNAILNPLQSKKNEDIRNEGTQQWRKPPQEGKMPSGKEEGGFMVGVLGWLGVATSGHKEAHPPSSSSGCLGSDAAAALKLRPSCPDYELSAEDEESSLRT